MARKSKISLPELLKRWQSCLRLEHWRIRIDWESRLPSNVRGRCFWEGQLQDATILINPYAKWTECYPIERTIIHELLHLHFAAAGDPCPDYVETAVDNLTTVIWKSRHGS